VNGEGSKQKIKRCVRDADTSLVFFEQEPEYLHDGWEEKRLRVAAYCRVSTENENQASSFTLQRKYYEDYIGGHSNWILAGIYADEGLSATSYAKREEFKRMLADCKEGKIDLIITKNVSRFSRNVVDCLSIIRELLNAKHPVGIYFQENNINTLSHSSEIMLTLLSSLAQAESEAKRDSMLWSIDKRFSRGQFLTPTKFLLGYVDNEDAQGGMAVEEEGAKTVNAIFKAFLSGYSLTQIAYFLTFYQRPTAKGNLYWSSASVKGILLNERYCGDVIAQKTFTVDVISHRKRKNNGQKRSVYKRNHHTPIISRDEYIQAQLLLKSDRNSNYYNPEYSIRIIRFGLLMGFIPMNLSFGGYRPAHYIGALRAAEIKLPPCTGEIMDIKNTTVTRVQEFSHSTIASLFISRRFIRFNRDCINFFPDTATVEILLHPTERLLAIRPASHENKNAVPWNDKIITAGKFCKIIYALRGWQQQFNFKVMADCFIRNEGRLMMFDLNYAESPGMPQPEDWRENFGRDLISHTTVCRRWLALTLDDWRLDAPAENVPGYEKRTGEDFNEGFANYLSLT
jgi:DNA invertase Pin-like site-specific DNA recombinase